MAFCYCPSCQTENLIACCRFDRGRRKLVLVVPPGQYLDVFSLSKEEEQCPKDFGFLASADQQGLEYDSCRLTHTIDMIT